VDVSANDLSICEGGSVVLTASPSGGAGAGTYQWQLRDGISWLDLSGGNSAVYNSPTLTAGNYEYRVRYTQNSGCDATSDTILVVVEEDALIGVVTNDPSMCLGGVGSLQATVVGGSENRTLKWETSPNGVDGWVTLPGEESETLFVNGDSTGITYYRALVTDTSNGCTSPVSTIQSVEVVEDIIATLSAQNIQLCVGGQVPLVASVTGGTDSIKFSWSVSLDSANWTPLATSTPTIDVNGDSIGAFYLRMSATDISAGCDAALPVTARVDVYDDPNSDVVASSANTCIGNTIMLDAQLSGGSPDLQIKWQESPDGVSDWEDIPGATEETYEILKNVIGDYYFRTLLSDAGTGCGNTSSDAIVVTYHPEPETGANASETEVCIADAVTMAALPSSGFGTYTYEWSTGETDSMITRFPTDTTTFTVTVTDESNCSTASSVTINVSPYPVISAAGLDTALCAGGVASLSATISGAIGPVTYQWEKFEAGSWNPVPLATAASFVTDPLTVGTHQYRMKVNSDAVCESSSSPVIVNVFDDPSISISLSQAEICVGGNIGLSASVLGGTGVRNIIWSTSPNGVSDWTVLDTTNEEGYSVMGDSIGTRYYRAEVFDTSSGCGSAMSGVASVEIFDDATVTLSADDPIYCLGDNKQLTAIVSGGPSAVSFLWRESTDGINWSPPMPGGPTLDLDTDELGVKYYEVVVLVFNSVSP